MSLEKTVEMEEIPSFKIPDVEAVGKLTDKALNLRSDIFNYLSIMSSYCDTDYISDGYNVSASTTPSTKYKELYDALYDEIGELASNGANEGLYSNYYYAAKDKAKEILNKNKAKAEAEIRNTKDQIERYLANQTYGNNSGAYPISYDRRIEALKRDIKKIKDLL